MSRIFDALQRAVVERNPGDDPGSACATELLERAERQAIQAWKPPAAMIAAEPLASTRTGGRKPRARATAELDTIDGPGRDELSGGREYPSILDRLPSLPITAPASQLAFLADVNGPAAEAFRLFAVRLRSLLREKSLKKILITSTTPQEGKSVSAANTACALASGMQERVLLLEGDIRRPTLCPIFGLDPKPGLCEYLGAKRKLEESIYKLEGADIWLMPAGTAPLGSIDVLRSPLLPKLIDTLTENFDAILIDSPPLLPLADASILGRLADGILLVTRQGYSEKRKLEKTLQTIDSQKLIGAILNSSTSLQESSYLYYRRDVEQ